MPRRRDAQPLPDPVSPMRAVAGDVPHGERWRFEFKWDGVRAVACAAPGNIRLVSRNGNDLTRTYPELGVVAEVVGNHRVVLDGEIVTVDAGGRPSFGLLQRRMHVRRPAPALVAEVPVSYYVFDLLHLDGTSLLPMPYDRRRMLLDDLDLPRRSTAVRLSACYSDVDGERLLEIAREHGLEGVVAKHGDGPYRPGRRDGSWIKTALRHTIEVIVGGFTPGEGRRSGSFGSLLLGARDEQGRLVYVGHVGTGFTDAMLAQLRRRLSTRERAGSPFDVPVPREFARSARWVRPDLVGEVEYRTVTPHRHLRHPVWRGLRPDRSPDEVTVPLVP
jgi:bifunctional non-homologous end joining protein LigD